MIAASRRPGDAKRDSYIVGRVRQPRRFISGDLLFPALLDEAAQNLEYLSTSEHAPRLLALCPRIELFRFLAGKELSRFHPNRFRYGVEDVPIAIGRFKRVLSWTLHLVAVQELDQALAPLSEFWLVSTG